MAVPGPAVPSKNCGFTSPQRRTAFANIKSRKSSEVIKPSSKSSKASGSTPDRVQTRAEGIHAAGGLGIDRSDRRHRARREAAEHPDLETEPRGVDHRMVETDPAEPVVEKPRQHAGRAIARVLLRE